jgi:hypothetical protein
MNIPGTGLPSGIQILPRGAIQRFHPAFGGIGLFHLSAMANEFARVQIKKPLCLRQRDLCARDWNLIYLAFNQLIGKRDQKFETVKY